MYIHGAADFIVLARTVAPKTEDAATDVNGRMIDAAWPPLQTHGPPLHAAGERALLTHTLLQTNKQTYINVYKHVTSL